LVPQALSGQLPEAASDDADCFGRDRKRRGRREASLDGAFRSAFMGIAFLLVAMALAFSRMGTGWWFWMLIPAFSMMGTGVAQYIRIKEREKRMFQPGNFSQPSLQSPTNAGAFPARNTGELVAPPPSVTEGTTRHLGAEAPTRHFGGAGEVPK
jgi:predicted phage tail protein